MKAEKNPLPLTHGLPKQFAEFPFEDRRSVAATREALRCLRVKVRKVHVFVITGPSGAGKTRLCFDLLKEATGKLFPPLRPPMTGDDLARQLGAAVGGRWQYLIFDNVPKNWLCRQSTEMLTAIVGAPRWTWRELGSSRVQSARPALVILISGAEVAIPLDLARRGVRRIVLADEAPF